MKSLFIALAFLLLNYTVYAQVIEAPGVYVEEVPTSNAPIVAVSTANTAMFVVFPQSFNSMRLPRIVKLSSANDYSLYFKVLTKKQIEDANDIRTLNSVYVQESVYSFFSNGGKNLTLINAESLNHTGFFRAIGLARLENDLNIFTAPGLIALNHSLALDVYQMLLTEAELRGNTIVIVDPPNTDDFAVLKEYRKSLGDNSHAAMYSSWIKGSYLNVALPPSLFVAGIYNKIDSTRGVWKSPAGLEAVLLSSRGGIAYSDQQWDGQELADISINDLRVVQGHLTVWGARTLARKTSEYTYVAVKRTNMMVSASIKKGLGWTVFEPNNSQTWGRVRLNVDSFLNQLFRQGAFQGQTPRQAYYIACNYPQTMSMADIMAGRLRLTIGTSNTRPAEFVITNIVLPVMPGN